MESKWYSNDLTEKEVKSLEKRYAKIKNARYGIEEIIGLALTISLDLEDGNTVSPIINNSKDIYNLLKETKAQEVKGLVGKVIEVYTDKNIVRSIGINENLI